MPTTGKERIKKFREKLKEDTEKHEEYLRKERERHKKKREKQRAKLNKDEKLRDHVRRKTRDRVRAHRLKKKTESPNISFSPIGTYKCLQTFGKAVRKVKNVLPNSPNKIVAVVKKVVADVLGPDVSAQLSKTSYFTDKGNKIPEESKQVVKEFFYRDDVSRQAPGMADCKTVKDPVTGKRIKKQKRHMVLTIAEAFQYFKTVHAEINIGKSSFFNLRPKEVLPVALTPHNVCVCAQHLNYIYLMDAIRKCIPNFPDSHKDLLKQLSCDITNENCMTSSCQNCPKDFWATYESLDAEAVITITWKQWISLSNHPKVTSITGTCGEALRELKNRTTKFKLHCYVKQVQSDHFEQEKRNVQEDEAVVQIDFAENYSLVSQDEIQSAHWNHEQVTIFTCCIWFSGDIVKPLVIISDDRTHSKYTVWTFLLKVIFYIQSTKSEITTVKMFSDNCAAQFKNRFVLTSLRNIKEITNLKGLHWDFFASSHGKGAVDGIGGSIKRLVWTAVKSRKVIVNTAKEFYDYVDKESKGIHAEYVSKEEIQKETPFLNVIWSKVETIPQIQTKHHFEVQNNCLHVSRTAASLSQVIVTFSSDASTFPENPLEEGIDGSPGSEICMNEQMSLDDTDCWSEDDLQPLGLLQTSQPVDEQSNLERFEAHSSGLIETVNKLKKKIRFSDVYTDSEDEAHDNILFKAQDIKPNVFVLVKILPAGSHKLKTIYKYVGICQSSVDEDTGEVQIMFLKLIGDNATMFITDENDVSDVPFEDIICMLPNPLLRCKGNRTFYEFEQKVDVFEKGQK